MPPNSRRALRLALSNASNEDILRTYFNNLLGGMTKRRIMDDYPAMSQRTMGRILQRLKAEGYAERAGATYATAYRRARD